jgi:SpoVK/Ycf46/Vps4 family AAA+-type ATPase
MTSNRLLFYGPKGCGKSYIAKILFGELNKSVSGWTTIELKKSAILRDPDKNIEKVFEKVKRFDVGGILIEDFDIFLDELSNFKSARMNLLENLKALNSKQILIATTRNPYDIDEKIILDFDEIIPFYYQNKNDRLDILKVHSKIIRNIKFDTSVNLNEIAEQTEWFSGEELKDLLALTQNKNNTICRADILDALTTIKDKINIKTRNDEMKRMLDFTLKYCTLKPAKEDVINCIKNLKIEKSDWINIIELKPNFFGLGINLNELINRLKKKV